MHEITLRAMRFHALVGILPHERTTPQPIEVDLRVRRRRRRGRSSTIARSTTSSRRVVDSGPIDFLEEIGERIARGALEHSTPHSRRRASPCGSRTSRSPGRSPMPRSSSSDARMVDVAYIALGSNVGDRHALPRAGPRGAGALPRTRIIAESSIEETEPLGPIAQGPYLNQMIALETSLAPRELLARAPGHRSARGTRRATSGGGRARSTSTSCASIDKRSTTPTFAFRIPSLPNRDFWQRELAEFEAACR